MHVCLLSLLVCVCHVKLVCDFFLRQRNTDAPAAFHAKHVKNSTQSHKQILEWTFEGSQITIRSCLCVSIKAVMYKAYSSVFWNSNLGVEAARDSSVV